MLRCARRSHAPRSQCVPRRETQHPARRAYSSAPSAHHHHHHGMHHSNVRSPIAAALDHAAHLLPQQGILENFIHHNPLHSLETMHFRDAILHVQKLESFMSPGERLFSIVDVDPRKRVNEALADLSSVFLDRGAAKWVPRHRERGFLYFFASLERLGFSPWRDHARDAAGRILVQLEERHGAARDGGAWDTSASSEAIIAENLEALGVPRYLWDDSIRAMLNELRGWAGMFRRMETHPAEAPADAVVRLADFCAVQSILTRASIETLARHSGWDPDTPLGEWMKEAPLYRSEHDHKPLPHTSAIAFADQTAERREQLETEFKHTLLNAIGVRPVPPRAATDAPRPSLQLYTCIDDRECSFRRHVEEEDAKGIETLGVAGFFGIPIRYQPADGRGLMVLAPEGNDPTTVMVETEHAGEHERTVQFNERRALLARANLAWEVASFSPLGSLLLSSVTAPISMSRLWLMSYAPSTKHQLERRMMDTFMPRPLTDFNLPLPPEQAASLLARTFKDVGAQRRFAPLVLVLGHGAISVNNPFAAAYNCGACGGREGGPNARLLARLANDAAVRERLAADHDVRIPDDTVFVGGMHNTTMDTVEYYDLDRLTAAQREQFARVQGQVQRALGRNALERCHRFMLAANVKTPEVALRHVQQRAVDPAEARPELNHATNAAVVVGRRDLTKGHFLDRRVFLPSYDPHTDDAEGTNLEHVLAPALAVCSGINLEYLFSTISVEQHGAGTKAPLNLVGNIGVLQGTQGDLRPGLPSQMTEMHTPVRALYIVDAPVSRVEAVLQRREQLRMLVRNEWVRLFVRDPTTNTFYRQVNGHYSPVDPRESAEYVPFTPHRQHAINVARREAAMYVAATVGMLGACAVPLSLYADAAMNPHGTLVAVCATMLSLPVLAFSRRYLHGEFMFARFASLCVCLLGGFNLVALAPTLEHALSGWSLFGFASTFLIGAYNNRPTVRNNATFAFAAYKISDLALLTAAVYTAHHAGLHAAAAGGLLLAALFKSSQFPLTSLFARSMEGPTPASALGYAGLSAHVGVVLLSSTMSLWYPFGWARAVLGGVGLFTAAYATLVAKTRADRKGALANATSATLGLIFFTLAMGHADLALLASLGHASFRIVQILRSPSIIADTQNLRSAIGNAASPRIVSDWLYRLSWALRRVDTDFHLINVLNWLSRPMKRFKDWQLTKLQQWLVTSACVVLAGAPWTPVAHALDGALEHLLIDEPALAGALMVGHFGVSVFLVRFLLLRVLDSRRFFRA